MNDQIVTKGIWEEVAVTSPLIDASVPVIAARGVPYVSSGNRLQTLNLYLPLNEENRALVGSAATSLHPKTADSNLPKCHVHVHGGAWRDPHLSGASIEPFVAHAFSSTEKSNPLEVIAALNYTLTAFPTHPDDPYDPDTSAFKDPAREAVHPRHVHDVLNGLSFLKSFGFTNDSYILTCHSSGACTSLQAILQEPEFHGLQGVEDAPTPAAIVALNGLYDLPALVYELGDAHAHAGPDYRMMLRNAFGPDEVRWADASPARFSPQTIASRVESGKVPRLVVLGESKLDQLVPMIQLERLQANLEKAGNIEVVRSTRATGYHALPWEGGKIFWESVQDVFELLRR